MRRPVKNRNIRKPDLIYKSVDVSTLVNYVMFSGKKSIAEAVVYDAFEEIKKIMKVEDPLEVYKAALRNAGPLMEIRSRRVGGVFLALRWIIDAARSKKGARMAKKLADEIIAASKNEGEAIKKRENVHKMAEANKAFAHFAW
jgi:small subunit ribosomal protein S7